MGEPKPYYLSCARLMEIGLLDPPPIPERMPLISDETPPGVSFYKMGLEDIDISGLSLPRTFVGRSRVSRARFDGTHLQESNFCWNSFEDVSFVGADLSRCDLRASEFERVLFSDAKLDGADLRRSWFSECKFDNASMIGATLTHEQGAALKLSDAQRAVITWVNESGPDPEGG